MEHGDGSRMRIFPLAGLVVATLAAGSPTLAAPPGAPEGTSVKPYAEAVGGEYEVQPLLSVGDRVQETTHPNLQYQMIGIPDGLGAHAVENGRAVLYMNHELVNTVTSEPVVAAPLNRGAFVSKYILDEDGDAITGERAYDFVYQENAFVGSPAQTDNATPAFARFCSAYLAGPADGFDRQIYLTNEEADGPATFDPAGGQTVAVFDNEAHALPKLGRFSKENSVVKPGTGERTVVLPLEDGPSSPDSQLYLYVGRKSTRPGVSVLRRNGLDNGRLFVFVPKDPSRNSELTFQEGTISGRWVEVPNAESLTDVQLEAEADALGAFGFVRIEDGAFSKTDSDRFFFDTTGGNEAAGNTLGRLYELRFGASGPLSSPTLTVIYNADRVIAAGGDIAISPDNVDTSENSLMVQEDGTTQSRLIMAQKDRDGSIWRFPLVNGSVDVAGRERVVELNPPGRDNIEVNAGIWETSGIIDASSIYGADTWLFDVQAHAPTTAPFPNTVEDGQLLLLSPGS